MIQKFPGRRRSSSTSAAARTKERASRSMPAESPTRASARSFSVKAGRFTLTPGRLMCRRGLSSPAISTAAADVGGVLLQHFQLDQAVVHQHGVAELDVGDQIPVIHVHRPDFLGGVRARCARLDR